MSGTRLGPYEIVAPIGAGGMGEVYRARDTRLNRTVAIKVLPSEFSQDAQLRLRFEREAKAISSLSHPHICVLHDVGREQDVDYIVMEFVEGQTLSERLKKGPLPIEQVLHYGMQIADALDKAHRQGIVHRDLKSSNIMMTKAGVKLLDFGLAKAGAKRGPWESSRLSQLPTAEKALTGEGKIAGTLEYMAPEQLEGKEADARTDIFALGNVLYRMATAKPPFEGGSDASLIASILERDPPLISSLQPLTPPALDRLVKSCLAKDPDERIQTAHDVMLELRWIGESMAETPRRKPTRRLLSTLPLLAIGVVLLVAGYLLSRLGSPRQVVAPAAPQLSFTQVTSDAGREFSATISPDGTVIAYVSDASGNNDIYLRRVGGEKSINLTESSADADDQPAFSPDGQRIAFRSEREGGGIFLMGATGESVRRVSNFGYHPAWSPDGKEIVVGTESVPDPFSRYTIGELWRINLASGERHRITEGDAVQPSWSPSGRRIAFWLERRGQRDIATVAANGGPPLLVTDDAPLDFSPVWSPDGKYLYFSSNRGGSINLWRVAIEESSGQPLGPPEPLTSPSRWAEGSTIASNGLTVAFTAVDRRANVATAAFDPVRGKVIGDPVLVTRGTLANTDPDISPSGEWIVFQTNYQQEDLYVIRANGTELRKLTDDRANDRVPKWSPDGKRIAFYSNRSGEYQIWAINADGSGLRQISSALPEVFEPVWSPDGKQLAAQRGGNEIILLDADRPTAASSVTTILPTERGTINPRDWSPDGKWLAGNRSSAAGSLPGIALYPIGTSSYRVLSDFGRGPAWLSDSRRLIFFDANKFFLADRVSGQVREIFSSSTAFGGPLSLTRDNRTICFTLDTHESDVWLMTIKSTED